MPKGKMMKLVGLVASMILLGLWAPMWVRSIGMAEAGRVIGLYFIVNLLYSSVLGGLVSRWLKPGFGLALAVIWPLAFALATSRGSVPTLYGYALALLYAVVVCLVYVVKRERASV